MWKWRGSPPVPGRLPCHPAGVIQQPLVQLPSSRTQVKRTVGGGLKRTPSWHSFGGTLDDTDQNTEEEADGTSVVRDRATLDVRRSLADSSGMLGGRSGASGGWALGAGMLQPTALPACPLLLRCRCSQPLCSHQHATPPQTLQLTTEAAALLGTPSVKVRRLNSGAEIIYRRLVPTAPAAGAAAATTSAAAATSAVHAGRGPSVQPPSRQGSGPQLNAAVAPTPATSGAQ